MESDTENQDIPKADEDEEDEDKDSDSDEGTASSLASKTKDKEAKKEDELKAKMHESKNASPTSLKIDALMDEVEDESK